MSNVDTSTVESPIIDYPMPRTAPYDPPPGLTRMLTESPVSRVRIWDGSTPWLITRDADIRAVLSDQRFSAEPQRPGFPSISPARKARTDRQTVILRPSLLYIDDPHHARLRRTLTAEFTVKRTMALKPSIELTVQQLLDDMASGPKSTDLVEAFAMPLPSLVICQMLGVPYDDRKFFQEESHFLVNNSAPETRVSQAVDNLQGYIDELVARKRVQPEDDLTSRLGARVDSGEITAHEAGALAWFLLLAGHETTANMIGLGTLVMLRNPELGARVRSGDDSQVGAVVEELLRYLTINHGGRRRVALEDVEVAGVTIREGDGVICAAQMANRDPAKWPRPNVIDPEHASSNHVAFGFGIHQCLGQNLARLELKIAYPALLRRFPDLRMTVPDSELHFRDEMNVYGVHSLPVAFGSAPTRSEG